MSIFVSVFLLKLCLIYPLHSIYCLAQIHADIACLFLPTATSGYVLYYRSILFMATCSIARYFFLFSFIISLTVSGGYSAKNVSFSYS